MDLSIPISGIQSTSAAFDSAATAITQAFNKNGNNSTGAASQPGDSVDLSSAVAALLKSKLDFMANVSVALVENQTQKSTFSLLA